MNLGKGQRGNFEKMRRKSKLSLSGGGMELFFGEYEGRPESTNSVKTVIKVFAGD